MSGLPWPAIITGPLISKRINIICRGRCCLNRQYRWAIPHLGNAIRLAERHESYLIQWIQCDGEHSDLHITQYLPRFRREN